MNDAYERVSDTCRECGRKDWSIDFEDRLCGDCQYNLALEIAQDFVFLLQQALSPAHWQEMRELNATETSEGVCHSHDHLDANMLMHAAVTKALERECDVDKDTWLWNMAWDIAKEKYLTEVQ